MDKQKEDITEVRQGGCRGNREGLPRKPTKAKRIYFHIRLHAIERRKSCSRRFMRQIAIEREPRQKSVKAENAGEQTEGGAEIASACSVWDFYLLITFHAGGRKEGF